MRHWAGPIGFIGAAASLVFWLVVPFTGGSAGLFASSGTGAVVIVFAVLSAIGVAGALIAGASSRLAPALLAAAIIPGIAALLVPGLLIVVAALLALDEPAQETRGLAR
jgi:hypothetical protein